LHAAVAGAVAAGVAVGASELAATVSHRLPSLVGSVGDQVINLAPRWLVQAGISNFGRNDKRVLVSAVTVLAVALGALFAVTGRKRPGIAFAGFVAFATLAGAAAAARPDVSAAAAVASALVAGAAGVVTLVALGRLAAEGDGADAGRRAFLAAAGGLAAAAALATRWWATADTATDIWRVGVLGGTLQVRALPDQEVELAGPAVLVADGVITLG